MSMTIEATIKAPGLEDSVAFSPEDVVRHARISWESMTDGVRMACSIDYARNMFVKVHGLDENKRPQIEVTFSDTGLDVDCLVDEALNAACLVIQTKLGVTDGGLAGVVFSGSGDHSVHKQLKDYIYLELEHLDRQPAVDG